MQRVYGCDDDLYLTILGGDEGFSCDTACKDQGDIWTDRSTDDACRYQ